MIPTDRVRRTRKKAKEKERSRYFVVVVVFVFLHSTQANSCIILSLLLLLVYLCYMCAIDMVSSYVVLVRVEMLWLIARVVNKMWDMCRVWETVTVLCGWFHASYRLIWAVVGGVKRAFVIQSQARCSVLSNPIGPVGQQNKHPINRSIENSLTPPPFSITETFSSFSSHRPPPLYCSI